MLDQFYQYTRDEYITLVPFSGAASIPYKWEIAKRLEKTDDEYGLPIHILYFGDRDDSGDRISADALKDIKEWCSVDFDFHKIGLTLEQVQQYNLPKNPDPKKHNDYQWEALDDKYAKPLIMNAIRKYWRTPTDESKI
jgi:hypothetical protein